MSTDRKDALLAVGLAAALLLQLAVHDAEGPAALNIAGGLLLTLPLAFRRTAPILMICVFGATGIANEALGGALFTFSDAGAENQEPPLFAALAAGMVAFYSLGAHAEDRTGLIGGVIGLASLWITVVASDQIEIDSFVWSGALVAATPWFAGRVARSRRQRIESLELEQEQQTKIALADERARIARELHDVTAHSVSVIAVQAQGARAVLRRDPERAEEALATIEQTARNALTELRRSLGVLRGRDDDAARAPQPGVADLEELLAGARSSGLDVELTVEGAPRELPQGVDLSAYRIVQEAITNAIRHTGGARTRVTLRYGPDELEIEVKDDGPGAAPVAAEGGGHGLIGMRERVATHGGELHAGAAAGGGFVVLATLPLA